MSRFVLATACDSAFHDAALNLVGSVQRRSPIFDEIFVYDLGLGRGRRHFEGIAGLSVREVEPFTEHWRQCWSWKPWVWRDAAAAADVVLYLDAGVEVLHDLTEVRELIEELGYFVVSQKEYRRGQHVVEEIVPRDYYARLGISPMIRSQPVVAAGVIGFRTGSEFERQVVSRCVELTRAGLNLGWSAGKERSKPIHRLDDPPVRDCVCFRHDQTLLNIAFYAAIASPEIQPMARFAARRLKPGASPLIWHKRRRGTLGCVGAIEYTMFRRAKNLRNVLSVRRRQRRKRKHRG